MSFNGSERLFAQLFIALLSGIIIPEPLYGAVVPGCASYNVQTDLEEYIRVN